MSVFLGSLAFAISMIDGSKKTYFVATIDLSRVRVFLKRAVTNNYLNIGAPGTFDLLLIFIDLFVFSASLSSAIFLISCLII